MSQEMVVVLVSDVIKNRIWLWESGIPQAIHSRLSKAHTVVRHFQEPSKRYPRIEHRHFVPIGLKAELAEVARTPLRKMTARMKSGWKGKMVQSGDQIISYDDAIRRIVEIARKTGSPHIALVSDDNVAVFPEALEFSVGRAREAQADVLYCSQIEGLLPTVVSADFLQKWLAEEEHPNPALLRRPTSIPCARDVVDLRVFSDDEIEGKIRCFPIDAREKRLLRYWEERGSQLKSAFGHDPTVAGPGHQQLLATFRQYRSEHAAALNMWHVVGTLYDVDQLRQRMITTSKPLTDYFVVATHYGLFLQRYANLRANSHVVDIGCSWGYLGFALANLLNKDGAYLGIEVQREATSWSRERLGWLGSNFRFAHLDIHNDYYNPDGSGPRSRVKLPIPDQWATVMFAASVFTHMLEDGVQAYMHELRRCLAPGGIVAFSYADSSYWGKSDEDYIVANEHVPDKTTYYSAGKIEEMVRMAGLQRARDSVNMQQFDRTEYQTWYFATRR
jgi:SAM-dependent methyltransferase